MSQAIPARSISHLLERVCHLPHCQDNETEYVGCVPTIGARRGIYLDSLRMTSNRGSSDSMVGMTTCGSISSGSMINIVCTVTQSFSSRTARVEPYSLSSSVKCMNAPNKDSAGRAELGFGGRPAASAGLLASEQSTTRRRRHRRIEELNP